MVRELRVISQPKGSTILQVDGIDFYQTAIDCAKLRWQLPNLKDYHDISSERLENQYDLLCSFEVLEHVEDWQALPKQFSNCATKYIALAFPVGSMRAFETGIGHLR